MFNKIANVIERAYDVPEEEKEKAKQTIFLFKKVIANLDSAKDHLSKMYEPFSAAQSVSPEALHKHRGAIFRFKEKSTENFQEVKKTAFQSLANLNFFSSDTTVSELVNSFRDSISKMEEQLTIFFDILDDVKSKDFKYNVVKSIDSLRKACFEVENLINDRIVKFINDNIIGENWTNGISSELNQKIEGREPYITKLVKERNEALKG